MLFMLLSGGSAPEQETPEAAFLDGGDPDSLKRTVGAAKFGHESFGF